MADLGCRLYHHNVTLVDSAQNLLEPSQNSLTSKEQNSEHVNGWLLSSRVKHIHPSGP